MADHHALEASSSINVPDASSESTMELNIKTLDSQIYSFVVDKNITVSTFKEKIAGQIGIPVGQQRLIFRGKVLKDDHLLSEYHVENGHTLHLVERQPSQSQPPSVTSTTEGNTNNGRQEPTAGGPRNGIGQISHSVVLGTANFGDQGEGSINGINVPDLLRVFETAVNSIGISNLIGDAQPGVQLNAHGPPRVNETEGTRRNAGTPSGGNQSLPGQTFTGPSLPHVVQIPVGAGLTIPSLNAPIPDSLNTLLEFMNRMEQVLAQTADQANQLPTSGDLPTLELPSNHHRVATPEVLGIVLRQAEHLIGGHAVAALSRIAGRLEQDAGSTDPTVRGQIQTDSVQVGRAMQHLGALFLELGRTILTLRMGRAPAESAVNAGPAVYISPAGPNPIMVQPFPLQTSSLFVTSAPTPNTGAFGPVGVGNIPRNVNIHIHTGASLAPIVSTAGPRATNAGGYPSQPSVISSGVQPGAAVSQARVLSATDISEINSRIGNILDNMWNEQQTSRDQSGNSIVPDQSVGSHTDGISSSNRCHAKRAEQEPQSTQHCVGESTGSHTNSKEEPSSSSAKGSQILSDTSISEEAPQSSQSMDNPDGSSATPIGLGLEGLQPKRRNRQSRPQGKSSDGATASNLDQSRMIGQQVLQSLASLVTTRDVDVPSSEFPPHSARGVTEDTSAGGQNADGRIDVVDVMSQVLHSPALDGLLTGVSQQTGIGSPDALRNMMEQVTQSPVMRNAANQLAQQIEGHNLGSMFSGLAGGQGGGIDLSRMIQQMTPVVSQALGGTSTIPWATSAMDSELRQSRPRGDSVLVQENSEVVGFPQLAQRIEQQRPPGEIFSALVENAVQLDNNGSGWDNVANELSSEEGLANEFMEMLRQDISRRLEDQTE